MARAILCALLACGVAMAEAKKPEPTKKAAHPGLEKLKKLAGTWVEVGKDGKPTSKVVSVVKVISAGSVVHETLFPGSPMEMISVYHVDKGELLMTHYCALGNQPRMKADPKSEKGTIRWVFDGGTGFDPAKDKHMHSATVTFVDDDHISIEGECWDGGKAVKTECGCMKLARKK